MTNLRSKLIRLAHQEPRLRDDLLPLIRTADKKPVKGDKIRRGYYSMIEGLGNLDDALQTDPSTKNDPKVKKAVKDLKAAQQALSEALDPYAWD